jgi:hypothetical protein
MKRIFIYFLFILSNCALIAQKGFDVQISSKKAEVGEEIQIVYSIHNLKNQNPQYTPPKFGELQVQGPYQQHSSNYSSVNGRMMQDIVVSLTYVVRGPKIGKFKISSASVVDGNETFNSGEINIEIVKAAPQQNTAGGGVGSSTDVDLKKDIFSKIVLNKSTAYVGEQILATIKVYTAVNLNGFEPTKVPNFNGFWSQNIKMPQQIQPTKETINGKPYLVFDVQKIILFPNKAGTLEITPLEVKTTAIVPVKVQRKKQNRQPRDWFEAMEMQMEEMMNGGNQYQYQQIPHTFTTGTAKINIKELPTKNKPADFTGAVGKYNFTTSIDKKECKTDDAVSYKMSIDGTGNLPLLETPIHPFGADFEVYDPKVDDNFNTAENFSGSKKIEYVAIPHQPGDFKIPGSSFSYFDLGKKDYVTITSPIIDLKITGKPSEASKFVSGNTDKEETKLIGKDIRFIHKNVKAEMSESGYFNSGLHWGLLGAVLMMMSASIIAKKRMEGLEGDADYMGNKRATKIAKARLASANTHLVTGAKQPFYNELVRGIQSYIGNKYQIEPSQLSRDNITDILESKNVDSSHIHSVIQIIDNCEMSLFSPTSDADMKSTYDQAVKVISDMEAGVKA